MTSPHLVITLLRSKPKLLALFLFICALSFVIISFFHLSSSYYPYSLPDYNPLGELAESASSEEPSHSKIPSVRPPLVPKPSPHNSNSDPYNNPNCTYLYPSSPLKFSTSRDVIFASLAIFKDKSRMSGHFAADTYRLLLSHSKSQMKARLVLFVDDRLNTDKELLSVFDEFSANLEIVWVKVEFPMVAYRFVFYLNYLKNMTDSIDRVMLIDARDSLFLADPFPFFPPNQITVNPQGCDGTHGFHKSGWTPNWVDKFYGRQHGVSFRAKKLPVLNVGTIFGDCVQMVKFLKVMETQMEKSRAGFKRATFGLDQAALNYAFHLGFFDTVGVKVGLLIEKDSPIALYIRCNEGSVDGNGYYLNSNGCPLAMLHGYDRSAKFLAQVVKDFPIPEGWSTSRAEDNKIKVDSDGKVVS
ncbi:hypothetical protein P9112_014561 [Eukaryota sp. TZLM1-RC]